MTPLDDLRAGDPKALEWLVRTHGGPIMSVCRRILRSHDETQDCL